MAEIKYTTDGKKVVVIGNLNSQEKIVQEIFVSGDTEIPGGENFVVKSLLDVPAESWKEKKLREIEERYERDVKRIEKESEELNRRFSNKSEAIKAKIQALSKLDSVMSEDSFSQLADFLSGSCEYVVVDNYGSISIEKYDDAIQSKDFGRFKELRLASIFGRTDGSLDYRINEYYDGSGSWKKVIPCSNKEDAQAIAQEILYRNIKENGYTESLIKSSNKLGIGLLKKEHSEYLEKVKERHLKNIESFKNSILKEEENLKKIDESWQE